MNPTALSTTIKLASSLWERAKDYREEKSREAYSVLETAAARMEERDNDWFPEARREAGAVTKAAHSRLERALEELKERSEDTAEKVASAAEDAQNKVSSKLSKVQKQADKKASKARKQAEKKASKAEKKAHKKAALVKKKARKAAGKEKKGSKVWLISALVAAVAAIAGGVFYFFTQKKEESKVPPRVEDFATPSTSAPQGSTLVYTSTTEDDTKVPAQGSDLAEDGVVERDEELLGSLDEQLAKHREEETATRNAIETEIEVSNADSEGVDTSRITDDHESEGKHRLRTEDEN
ncbi:hypothetical protein [Corynebacterium sp. HMSC05E07]|uniref:hypothetical protein n=1 Tax=Corynebacterium sp. HMSC05E07 TaxID=1581117 RepID=UPI0008A3117B|nr:hypothetical protein [Corynebacterium sp. HMSC05E07]OFT61095.1 hypothetical protein HMPREF3149_06765 [Corynebacterium sp. HMSC05E07]